MAAESRRSFKPSLLFFETDTCFLLLLSRIWLQSIRCSLLALLLSVGCNEVFRVAAVVLSDVLSTSCALLTCDARTRPRIVYIRNMSLALK